MKREKEELKVQLENLEDEVGDLQEHRVPPTIMHRLETRSFETKDG